MRILLTFFSICTGVILLSACGGGGSSGGAVSAEATVNCATGSICAPEQISMVQAQ